MMPQASNESMLSSLPVRAERYTVRHWSRRDVDTLACWPSYAFPYEAFNFSFRGQDGKTLDEVYRTREKNPCMMALVVDHDEQSTIGYCAPHQIDWVKGHVGNIGLRIHPAWCGKGVGTCVLREISRWCLTSGLRRVSLDVAASNTRAIRCYEKVGFEKTGEMWRGAPDLAGVDLDVPGYAFVRPHLRWNGGAPELRFWLI